MDIPNYIWIVDCFLYCIREFYFNSFGTYDDYFCFLARIKNKETVRVKDNFCADEIIAEIQKRIDGDKPIYLYFDSSGSTEENCEKLTIFLLELREENIPVYAIVHYGCVNSAAIPPFFAAKKRFILGDIDMFFHNVQLTIYPKEKQEILCKNKEQREKFKQDIKNQLLYPINNMCKRWKDIKYMYDNAFEFVINENANLHLCEYSLKKIIKLRLGFASDNLQNWKNSCDFYRTLLVGTTKGKISYDKAIELCENEITLKVKDLVDLNLIDRVIY